VVALLVQDRGIGIAGADKRRIFDDFYRGDTRVSSRHGGVGLGLALVRRVVAAHGGRIDVDSERGRGSTFTVWLPVPGASSSGPEDGRAGAGASGEVSLG
jgi:signal transduction histidine kinase